MVDLLAAFAPRLDHAGRYRAEGHCPLHGHAGLEILHIRSGRCLLQVGDETIEARGGHVFTLPARTAHRHHDLGEVATSYLVLRAPPRAFPSRLRCLDLGPEEVLGAWIEQLIDLHLARQPADQPVIGALLLAVLARIERLDANGPSLPRAVQTAMAHLDRHLLTTTPPAALAALAGVSEPHLRALFRAHLGAAPQRWLRRRRLELACRLLRDSALTVAEVAQASGWADANHFGRVFRSEMGRPPGAWRDALRAKPGTPPRRHRA